MIKTPPKYNLNHLVWTQLFDMSCQVYSDSFFETIIVGGGTCGLAVAARLCEDYPGSIYTEDEHQRFHWLKQRGHRVNLINHNVSSRNKFKPPKQGLEYKLKKKFAPEELLVLDAVAPRFMGQWDNQFASCQIPYLRLPMFFHPDPVNVDGMISFAHLNRREGPKDLMEINNVVGKEYSKHQLKKLAAKNMKKQALSPAPRNIAGVQDRPGIIDINMRDWKDYYRPSTPFFCDFCRDIVARYHLEDRVRHDEVVSIEYADISVIDTDEVGKGFIIRTASGREYASKICVVTTGHRGNINYPLPALGPDPHTLEGSCHTTHIFSRAVEFPPARLRLVLAPTIMIIGGGLTSAQLAHVCANAGIKVHFLLRGPLKVKHFDFHLDWVTKYKNVKKSAFYIKDTDEERFQMIQDAREGGSVNPEYHRKLMKHVKSGMVDLRRFTQLTQAVWDEDTKKWACDIETADPDSEPMAAALGPVDYIVCATGISPDIEGLPYLQSIIKNHKIDCVRGLPCLTDNLQWNDDIPLFMVGKNASLRTGPSSANLDGARSGAERIGWFIQEERSLGKFDWAYSSESEEDFKLHDDDTASEESTDDSYNTRLRLASGQLNWYSLLQEE